MRITCVLRANNAITLQIEDEQGRKTIFYWLYKHGRCHSVVTRSVLNGIHGESVIIPATVVHDGVIRETDNQYIVRVIEETCATCGEKSQRLEISY